VTLSTTLEILDQDANPEELFSALREQVGIPSGHEVQSWRSLTGEEFYPGVTFLRHVPGDFPAAAEILIRPDPRTGWFADEEDSGWYVRLRLDTALGGRWSQQDRWQAFRSVVERCGVRRSRVNNEYTGEWFWSFEDLLPTTAPP
jgi:hypothetical protein